MKTFSVCYTVGFYKQLVYMQALHFSHFHFQPLATLFAMNNHSLGCCGLELALALQQIILLLWTTLSSALVLFVD